MTRRRLLPSLLASAASLALAACGDAPPPVVRELTPAELDARRAAELQPSGVVAALSRFTWRWQTVASGVSSQRLLARDLDDPEAAEVELASVPLHVREWSPDAAARERLPRRFAWRISVRDARGREVGSSPDARVELVR